MARTNPDAQRFGAWLRPLVLARSLNQTDLRKRLEEAGIAVGRQTVSQWYNGDNTPQPDTVVLIAQILRVPAADALRQAGHLRVAELIEGTTAPEGGSATPAIDPIIQEILDDPAIPSDVKPRAIAFYKRRMAQAKEDLEDFGLTGP